MIKRIIFDLDDTILPWKEEYWNTLGKALKSISIKPSKELLQQIRESVDFYESYNKFYNKQDLLKIINKKLNFSLPINFIDTWLSFLETCIPNILEKEEVSTLQYLSSHYELVILTDWFEMPQRKRLANCNLLSYFTEIYAAENFPRKPDPKSYLRALGNHSKEDVVMIGDSLEKDIKPCLNLGIKAIYYNPKQLPAFYNFPCFSRYKDLPTLIENLS